MDNQENILLNDEQPINDQNLERLPKRHILFYQFIKDLLIGLILIIFCYLPLHLSKENIYEYTILLKVFLIIGLISFIKSMFSLYLYIDNHKSNKLICCIESGYSFIFTTIFWSLILYSTYIFIKTGFNNLRQNAFSTLALFILTVTGLVDIIRNSSFFIFVLLSIPLFLWFFSADPINFISRYGLDPEFIDNWPTHKATKEDLVQCVICTEEINEGDQIIKLRCNPSHIFHDTCIKAWLKRRVNCPLCRSVYLL